MGTSDRSAGPLRRWPRRYHWRRRSRPLGHRDLFRRRGPIWDHTSLDRAVMAIEGSGAGNQPSSTLSRAMVGVTTVAMFGAAAAMFLF